MRSAGAIFVFNRQRTRNPVTLRYLERVADRQLTAG